MLITRELFQSMFDENVTQKKVKSFPEPLGGAALRIRSPQPDTSVHRNVMDTGLVYQRVHLLTPQLCWYPFCRPRGMARLS